MPSLRLFVLQTLALCSVMRADASQVATASEVASLNRVTFAGNVFANKEGEGPEGWVVLFCAQWFEPCQMLQETFLTLATQYGGTSHEDLFSRTYRFAQVDCAIDKVLCNSQDVDAYPTVVHYRRGGRAGEWSQSGRTLDKEAKSFGKWLSKQMQETQNAVSNVIIVDDAQQVAGSTVSAVAKFSSGVSLRQ